MKETGHGATFSFYPFLISWFLRDRLFTLETYAVLVQNEINFNSFGFFCAMIRKIPVSRDRIAKIVQKGKESPKIQHGPVNPLELNLTATRQTYLRRKWNVEGIVSFP